MRFYSTHTLSGHFSRQRRGSILFLVLASLVFLALICATMLYSTQLEIRAAANGTLAVQNRMTQYSTLSSTLSALPSSVFSAPPASGSLSSAEPSTTRYQGVPLTTRHYQYASLSQNHRASASFAVASAKPHFQFAATAVTSTKSPVTTATSFTTKKTKSTALSTSTLSTSTTLASGITLTDLSGRLNLTDPCLPFETLEKTVSLGLTSASLNIASAPKIAHSLLDAASSLTSGTLLRSAKSVSSQSSSSKTSHSESLVSSALSSGTLRRSDMGVYIAPEQLRARADLSAEQFNAVASLITTWSAAYEIWSDAAGHGHVCVPLQDASASQLFETLRALYPDASVRSLAQYALNIVDHGSAKRAPTQLKLADSNYPLLGYKPNPIISQICSDVITSTEDGDNGEYLQITNPTSSSISLAGWRVQWTGGSYTFGSISLAAGAHVVLTDNISTENSQHLQGIGTFNQIFNVRPLSPNLILEQVGMDLPDASGVVQLLDVDGNLIDYMTYTGGTFQGNSRAFYRTSPFVRAGVLKAAVPFTTGFTTPSNALDAKRWSACLKGTSKPCQTVGDLFSVPLGSTDTTASWFPTLGDSDTTSTTDSVSVFDERLLDAFTQDKVVGAFDANGLLQIWDPASSSTVSTVSRLSNPFPTTSTLTATTAVSNFVSITTSTQPSMCGLINVNTAPVEVLQSLPGMDAAIAKRVVTYRTKMIKQGTARPFDNLSSFVAEPEIWSALSASDHLDAIVKLVPYITWNSISYQILSVTKGESAGKADTAAPRTTRGVAVYRDGKWMLLSVLPLSPATQTAASTTSASKR
ncbi:TPA: hypothetical protein DDW35_07025 [Candidatus Sumerlaeota bacterium]|nr:hypothetical protein [Candidatus Sumerlaeota bacterium]